MAPPQVATNCGGHYAGDYAMKRVAVKPGSAGPLAAAPGLGDLCHVAGHQGERDTRHNRGRVFVAPRCFVADDPHSLALAQHTLGEYNAPQGHAVAPYVVIRRMRMTRWRIPFAGFLLALMGGISYAWGVFVIPLMDRFRWTKTEATLPFTLFMIIFSLSMVPGGKLQDALGPRKVAAGGAVLFLFAYGLASLIGYLPNVWWLIFSYSLLGGVACGLTYACVAPPARKWFPDKPVIAISFGVMGFGLAALVFAPLKASYLIPVLGI
jgi:hypothetical protein